MNFFYIFILFFITNPLLSQTIFLETQEQIDNFKQVYGNPKTLDELIIGARYNNIKNMDSLDNLEYIKKIFNFAPWDSLRSVKGLKKLRKCGFIQLFVSPNDSLAFPALDTADWIWIKNTTYTNITIRPTLFKNIKYISGHLAFQGNIATEGFPYFNHNNNLILEFSDMKNLDSIRIKNNRFDKIQSFAINFCENVIGSGIRQLDHVDDIYLFQNSNCDFPLVSLIKSIHRFYYRNNRQINKFGEGFKQIHVIDSIEFGGNQVMPPFKNIFPNLLLVKDRIYIRNNADLKSIADYDNIYINRNFEDSIVIRDNKLLTNCNVDFLCQALEYIPERTIIQNNGSGCTIEEIKKYCTVKTKDVQTAKVDIYPNPADSYFSIDGLETGEYNYQLYHLDGRPISRGLIYDDHQVDITCLDQGMYLLEITSKDGRYRAVQKVVKM